MNWRRTSRRRRTFGLCVSGAAGGGRTFRWRGCRRSPATCCSTTTAARTPELVESARIDALFDNGPPDGPDATALVYWGLARLSRRRGELLEAFYLEGKKTAVIALEFRISERAVEGRLRRARQALRTQLERMIKQNGEMR